MPFWRNEIGRPQDNLTQIETNVRYGTAILSQYLREARGDLIDALARYNGSRGRLNYPELVVYAYRARWQTQTTDDLAEAAGRMQGLQSRRLRRSQVGPTLTPITACRRLLRLRSDQCRSDLAFRIDDYRRGQHGRHWIAETRTRDPCVATGNSIPMRCINLRSASPSTPSKFTPTTSAPLPASSLAE